MGRVLGGLWRGCRTALLVLCVVAAGAAGVWFALRPPPVSNAAPMVEEPAKRPKIARTGNSGITVPPSMAENMRLKTVVAVRSTEPMRLPAFQGVLAWDLETFQRVHSRFPGEVMASKAGESSPVLHVGDKVEKGQLLAVVWSKDLGEKKSELIDALSRLKADELVFNRLQGLFKDGGTPERSLREAERTVQSDRVAVEKAEATLRTWRLNDAEIAAIRAEADRINLLKPATGHSSDWARVEVLANRSGTILEKNVAVGDIVDTTTDLFKIADLSQLVVSAHVFEEDLTRLEELPKPVAWTVMPLARPGCVFPGTLERIGTVIDPNQHTALVTGKVENKDGKLRIGEFVTVSVEIPAPAQELALPADTVVEDGRESVVFVETDPTAQVYVRKPVKVIRRTRETLFARETPEGVQAGDRVVAAGSILLRDAMEALPPAK